MESVRKAFAQQWSWEITHDPQVLDKIFEDDRPYAGVARQIVNWAVQPIDSG